MGELIKGARVIAKDGELHITLDLNITVNGVENRVTHTQKIEKQEEDEMVWAIPDFKSAEKLNFGKKKEEI